MSLSQKKVSESDKYVSQENCKGITGPTNMFNLKASFSILE